MYVAYFEKIKNKCKNLKYSSFSQGVYNFLWETKLKTKKLENKIV